MDQIDLCESIRLYDNGQLWSTNLTDTKNSIIESSYIQKEPIDLKNKVSKIDNLDEAISIFNEIAILVRDLHQSNYFHLNLNPETIVFENENITLINPIINLGTSRIFLKMKENPKFFPPEIIKEKNYGPEADVWSLGLIFYYILYKRVPWQELDFLNLKSFLLERENLQKAVFDFTDKSNYFISDDIKNLIIKMTCFNRMERLNLKEIVKKLFIIKNTEMFRDVNIGKEIIFSQNISQSMNLFQNVEENVKVNQIKSFPYLKSFDFYI